MDAAARARRPRARRPAPLPPRAPSSDTSSAGTSRSRRRPTSQSAFFDGYARCAAAADLFRWSAPRGCATSRAPSGSGPARLDGVQVWWGGRDRVVGPAELRWTEAALGVRWPERTFPHWGHYPMIEDPEGWVRAVAATVPAEAPFMIDR